MDPSSFIISQITPAGFSPAIAAKSTDASVCPALIKTPPSFATSGNICPGRVKSDGNADSSTIFCIVSALSAADIPVVVSIWSIDTVKAVSFGSVLSETIDLSPSSEALSFVIGAQISPLPYFAMKLIDSVVASSAAISKSPSFSRFSSSTTIIIFPFLMSSIASSILLNFIFYISLYKSVFINCN